MKVSRIDSFRGSTVTAVSVIANSDITQLTYNGIAQIAIPGFPQKHFLSQNLGAGRFLLETVARNLLMLVEKLCDGKNGKGGVYGRTLLQEKMNAAGNRMYKKNAESWRRVR